MASAWASRPGGPEARGRAAWKRRRRTRSGSSSGRPPGGGSAWGRGRPPGGSRGHRGCRHSARGRACGGTGRAPTGLRASSRRDSSAPGSPTSAPDRRGDSIVVRFRFTGARAVAIAGDWNEWRPVPLVAVGDEVWERALLVAPGTHQFNLLVDGEWVVPHGVATLADELGGLVALLVVP